MLCRRQTSVNAKTTLIRFASDLSHRLIAIYIEDYMNIFNSLLYYNMTAIAKFYNKFLSFIELDPTRPTHICKFSDPAQPDLTRPAGRPDARATLYSPAAALLSTKKYILGLRRILIFCGASCTTSKPCSAFLGSIF